jgi:hypothetical protein
LSNYFHLLRAFNSTPLRFIECQLYTKPRPWPSGSPYLLGKTEKGRADYGIKRNELKPMAEDQAEFCKNITGRNSFFLKESGEASW